LTGYRSFIGTLSLPETAQPEQRQSDHQLSHGVSWCGCGDDSRSEEGQAGGDRHRDAAEFVDEHASDQGRQLLEADVDADHDADFSEDHDRGAYSDATVVYWWFRPGRRIGSGRCLVLVADRERACYAPSGAIMNREGTAARNGARMAGSAVALQSTTWL
jgi:hypothetical protein